jgi:hypothetical protein
MCDDARIITSVSWYVTICAILCNISTTDLTLHMLCDISTSSLTLFEHAVRYFDSLFDTVHTVQYVDYLHVSSSREYGTAYCVRTEIGGQSLEPIFKGGELVVIVGRHTSC